MVQRKTLIYNGERYYNYLCKNRKGDRMIELVYNLNFVKVIRNENGLYIKPLSDDKVESLRIPDSCYVDIHDGFVHVSITPDTIEGKETFYLYARKLEKI
jgi:hypothetical protein